MKDRNPIARTAQVLIRIAAGVILFPLVAGLIGDVNNDGSVNVQDLVVLSPCLGQPAIGACVSGDVTGDGLIDLFDLVAVAKEWRTGGPSVCGDGVLSAGESCDSNDLNGATCLTMGFDGGILQCSAACQLDTTGCAHAVPPTLGPFHEPLGSTVITDRSFDTKATQAGDTLGAAGWDPIEYRYANIVLTQDPTAPLSPDTVVRMNYPAGFAGGSAPGLMQKTIARSAGYRELYIRFSLRLSDTFFGHPSNTNKIFHFWVDGGNKVFLSAEGKNMSTLQMQVRLQGSPATETRARLPPNTGKNGNVARGAWQTWEFHFVTNTPGLNDGVVEVWRDGVLTHNYTDVGMAPTGIWEQVQWSPTWGGTGATTPHALSMDIDHVFVSAK